MPSNFDFLKTTEFGDLSTLIYKAELYLFDEPNFSIILIGQFTELLIKIVFSKENLSLPPDKQNHFSRIQLLHDYNIITEDLTSDLHHIRLDRNKIAHINDFKDNIGFKKENVISDLRRTHFISNWFLNSYSSHSIITPFNPSIYSEPVTANIKSITIPDSEINSSVSEALLTDNLEIINQYRSKISDPYLHKLTNIFLVPEILNQNPNYTSKTLSDCIIKVYLEKEKQNKARKIFISLLCNTIKNQITTLIENKRNNDL